MSSKPRKAKSTEPDDPAERERVANELLANAKSLWDFIRIEVTVGSQVDSVKRQIADLSRSCRQKTQEIKDLTQKIAHDRAELEALGPAGEAAGDAAPAPAAASCEVEDQEDWTDEREYIVQLEKRLQSLYEDRANLVKASRQGHKSD
jgi:hypothetical protein